MPATDRRTDTAAAVLMEYVESRTAVLRSLADAAREGDADGIHDMRTNARRLRSVLQAGGRLVDRGRTTALVEHLRWLGRELGALRDLDVQEERIATALAARPPEEVPGPVAAELTRWFAPRRAAAVAAAREALESPRYVKLLVALDHVAIDPPLTDRAEKQARGQWRRVVRKAARRVGRAHAVAEGLPAGPDRDRALHATRKAAKRLRYAAEAAVPALPEAERVAKRAKKVQRLLGEHHDAVTLRPVLRELAARAHADGGTGFAHGVLHEAAAVDAARAEAALGQRMRALEKAVRRAV